MEQYQDLWCKGRTIQTGVRPCGERWWRLYEFLKPNPPETVLDLGNVSSHLSGRGRDLFALLA
jgi:hypothetical protein